jgi:peroxiredoxin
VLVAEQKKRLDAAGAEVVLVGYDSPSLLAAKIMAGLEVTFRLVLDPERSAYRQWGMGRMSWLRMLSMVRLTGRYLKLLLRGEKFLGFAPDMGQLGGDFVVDRDGRIAFAHVMRDNGDRVVVEKLVSAVEGLT